MIFILIGIVLLFTIVIGVILMHKDNRVEKLTDDVSVLSQEKIIDDEII